MTSSLVGSEMCIRDSVSTDHYPVTAHISMNLKALAPRSSRTRFIPLPPVSYTHLTLPTICSV
eukprot:11665232-Prorocentrum_lima.AAC.1